MYVERSNSHAKYANFCSYVPTYDVCAPAQPPRPPLRASEAHWHVAVKRAMPGDSPCLMPGAKSAFCRICHEKVSGSSLASSAGHLIHTAPASASFLQVAPGVLGVLGGRGAVGDERSSPSHQIVSWIFLRFSPLTISSGVHLRQYRPQQISNHDPTRELSSAGGSSGCSSARRSISPVASSSSRFLMASSSSSSGECSLIELPISLAWTVGVPIALETSSASWWARPPTLAARRRTPAHAPPSRSPQAGM